ncbi:hypothetical protein HN587_04900 [Candidatus Woesearchaeota archaeon]|nr:hypothetical protein [Candidatus Woesearchaeota archaeon]
MTDWKFIPQTNKIPKLNNPVLVEGMPGIGNVGKIAVDFIIEQIKAKKVFEIFSYDLPNSVFINEHNRVELPLIEVYYKKFNGNGKDKAKLTKNSKSEKKVKKIKSCDKRDLIIITGDLQPTDGRSCYAFCDSVLSLFKKVGGSEIITLGGIGLGQAPKKPQVYCTANNSDFMTSFQKGIKINHNIFGVVGPIIGVSGLLIGLAERQDVPGICLLAETLGHPAYLGVGGAREIIKILDKKLNLGISIKKLDKEIAELEKELSQEPGDASKVSKSSLKKITQRLTKETSYIG